MDWKWQLLIALVVVLISERLGYILGIKAKKPYIVADGFEINDNKAYIVLKNIGTGVAINVKIEDTVAVLSFLSKDTPIIYTFEKVNFIEPSKQGIVHCKAYVNKKEIDSYATNIFSPFIEDKDLIIEYKDNFTNKYKNKFRIKNGKIEIK